ncbi:CDGSH iron-sulfur domain-containing protein [Geminicoccaceae bacterium 1502E]|uniref:CDGSH iron-sulfur domain-containing protein n=1 Tax=Marinimicrococcus flavescens TaxID=3031815 RepID=A0AAP3UZI9_9PROT|nr:CDGSH iron-sulfur domain-containing protein [Marinimicrococcus flavescens]MDX6752301.1 CDGSH iron-sulfur domain-containing protein [Geminicoccaceae bacterium 1502E]
MSEPTIARKAPFKVDLEAGRTYWWCACGQSARQPFCDGSHKGSGLAPVKHVPESAGSVWLCGCKHTARQPFCDGTHKGL